MQILFIISIGLIFLGGCSPKNYPSLNDVPPYTPPSISLVQVQKEINELKLERSIASNTYNK